MKRFLTQIKRLFRESRVGSQKVQNDLRQQGGVTGLEFHGGEKVGLGRGYSLCVWAGTCLNFSSVPKKGAPRLCYQLFQVRDRKVRRIEVVGLES